MIDLQYLNQSYKQTGGLCVMACYGLILEYYSKSTYPIGQFYNEYLSHFNPDQAILDWARSTGVCYPSPNNNENSICAHYHHECIKTYSGIRGLQFVKMLHVSDFLDQLQYCKIVSSEFDTKPLPRNVTDALRPDLASGGLAIVIIPEHAILIGFDPAMRQYFIRDPLTTQIVYEDFLGSNEISEYLLFRE
ncbi:MAG: hypothetical protein IPI77_18390 [Saprospiraceae bacterium]|nr:hypothetical protein [Saprospiraceae bacterium]